MAFIPQPIIRPPEGLNYLAENQVKADAFGNLTGLIAQGMEAKQKRLEKEKSRNRANRLVNQLTLNADERFAPHRETIVEAMAKDPVDGAKIVNDLRQMFLMDDTKNSIAQLRADMAEETRKAKKASQTQAIKVMTDATKKVFATPMTRAQAEDKFRTYSAPAAVIGQRLEIVESTDDSDVPGVISRTFNGVIGNGFDDGKRYIIKTHLAGPTMPQDASLEEDATTDPSNDPDASLRLSIQQILQGK